MNRERVAKYRIKGVSSRYYLTNYILAKLVPWKPWLPYTGFKLFNEQLEYWQLSLGDILQVLRRPPVIVLYRENILETFVSLKIAFQTDLWYSDDKVNYCSIEVDWDEFQEYANVERVRWKNSMAALVNCRVIFISYEELAKDKEETVKRIFTFLGFGCEHDLVIETDTKRQNPLPLERKVTNYREIQEKVAASKCDIQLTSHWLQGCRNTGPSSRNDRVALL